MSLVRAYWFINGPAGPLDFRGCRTSNKVLIYLFCCMVESHYWPAEFDMVFTFIARPFAYNYFHIYHSDLAMTNAAVARRLKIGW